MSDTSTFNAAQGVYKTSGNVKFTPSSGIGEDGVSSGDAGVELTFDNENWWLADQVSLNGGETQTEFTVVSSGTFTESNQNSNFYNDYPQFSAEDPPTYVLIELDSGEELMFFPESPDIEGDFNGTVFLVEEGIIPCFTPGTLIATSTGERPVEDLRKGDRVITRDHGVQPIRWVGRRSISNEELEKARHLMPVLIREGALGDGLPVRDLLVSPQHRILLNNDKTALYFEEREVLAAAKHLTSLKGIDVVEARSVSYIHFMFDQHEVVLSNGIWTESFQPGVQTLAGMDDAQRTEIFELFPQVAKSRNFESYRASRRSLRKHEARLLVD
ncbi:MAG: Hint domain-containing protein [Paracoccaceae bacterium]